MASDLLHIKDSYYFEVPKALWRSARSEREDFPDHYIRLDPDYQDWEAERLYEELAGREPFPDIPPKEEVLEAYRHWRVQPENFAKPFDRYLEEAPGQTWFQKPLAIGAYAEQLPDESGDRWNDRSELAVRLRRNWEVWQAKADDLETYNTEAAPWPAEKIEEYNSYLDGKIMIPQPFGTLKNNYEPESGFAISKFMILELVVAIAMIWAFTKLAQRISNGRPPRGRLWNMFEAFLMFIRNEVAVPAIGKHDADRFVPLLWTIFLFILGLNLMGMIPWLGAPTGSFSVTLAMALVTFATVLVAGMLRFGFFGFWKNQVPSMGLPLVLAIPIVPMLFAIEVLGLFIKHAVLAVRLLANMVAGHLVLLAIMGLAVAAAESSTWLATALVAVVGSALFSCLELFVGFLQAYVFTFLSALFIGAAVHHH